MMVAFGSRWKLELDGIMSKRPLRCCEQLYKKGDLTLQPPVLFHDAQSAWASWIKM